MSELKDLTGRTFGRWTVLARAPGKPPSLSACWVCRCECGTTRPVFASGLVTGHSRSCGCLNRELSRARQPSLSHGQSRAGADRHVEYRTWQAAKRRCGNQKSQDYRDYGGRGITMCPEWRDSFEAFLHDMGPKPSAQHSLDRRDNDGDYEPGNCRWATAKEQRNNRRPGRPTTP